MAAQDLTPELNETGKYHIELYNSHFSKLTFHSLFFLASGEKKNFV